MKNKAFSLIEIIVTIVLIGVISSVALISFKGKSISGDLSAKALLSSILTIENNSYINNGELLSSSGVTSHDSRISIADISTSDKIASMDISNNLLKISVLGGVGCWYIEKDYSKNGREALWGYKDGGSTCSTSDITHLSSNDNKIGYSQDKPIIIK